MYTQYENLCEQIFELESRLTEMEKMLSVVIRRRPDFFENKRRDNRMNKMLPYEFV